jgi:phosphoglycolate phosphatase
MIEAFLAAGEIPPDPTEVQATIGLSVREMIKALAPALGSDRHEKILNGYRLRYFDLVEDEDATPACRGASHALSRLSDEGFALGLATGKAARSLSHVLKVMRWTRHFQTVQCADGNPSKPSPIMVEKALAETGHAPRDTILVGDSRYDMQMARAAGVIPVGVAWGYTSPEVLLAAGAKVIARDFDELVEIVSQIDADRFALC